MPYYRWVCSGELNEAIQNNSFSIDYRNKGNGHDDFHYFNKVGVYCLKNEIPDVAYGVAACFRNSKTPKGLPLLLEIPEENSELTPTVPEGKIKSPNKTPQNC